MKKKNVVVTLAAIAISAVPLMAQQLAYTTPDEESLKEIKASVQQEITAEQQQQNDAIVAAKYERVTNDFNTFMNLMNNKSLANKPERTVGQMIFVAIDDLAESILNLPQPSRDIYVGLFASSNSEERPLQFHFVYKNYKEYNLNSLFDLATAYLSSEGHSVWLNRNTDIEKLLDMQTPDLQAAVKNWKPSEYDKAFLEVMSSRINESNKIYDSHVQKLNTQFNKKMEILTTLLDNNSLKTDIDNQNDRRMRYNAIQAVKQSVFVAIDDVARALYALPLEEREAKYQSIVQTLSEHEFKYLGKHLTLQELFDFSTTGGAYYDENTPINKLLNETRVQHSGIASISLRNRAWERFIENTVIKPAKAE